MTTSTASFITTAIPYVNARPHLGFAYELVLADAIARHRRRRGRDVRFVTGTDDNGLKNVTAAAREGLAPAAFVDRNADAFVSLGRRLSITPDDFVRTSRDCGAHAPRAATSIAGRGTAGTAPAARRSSTTASSCAPSTPRRPSR